MEDFSGRDFGAYRIVGPLGEGGMAAVYKAYQPALDHHVALKILPRALAADPEFRRRFQREAKLVAQLQHPHILPIFDFGESDGCPFLAMPFIRGGTLAARLRGGLLPIATIERVLVQVCAALSYAHGKNVIHRDVKPSNILIDETGNYLLGDFGVARVAEALTTFTTTGTLVGTPEYMSPEQASGIETSPQSDLYSLGIVLYEMLTGRVPYKAQTPVAVALMHLTGPLPPPSRFNAAVSPSVEAVVLKALARRRADRFATAEDLATAFSGAVHPPQAVDQVAQVQAAWTSLPTRDALPSMSSFTTANELSPSILRVPSSWRFAVPWLVVAAVLSLVISAVTASLQVGSAPASAPVSFNRPLLVDSQTARTRSMAPVDEVAVQDALGEADRFFRQRDYTTAIQRFDEILKMDPNREIAWRLRGTSCFWMAQYDCSLRDFTQAIRLDPNDLRAYRFRAATYRYRKDFERALSDIDVPLRMNPVDNDYFTRAEIYYDQQRYDKAVEDLNAAIQLSNTDLYRAKRGDALFRLQQYDLAVNDYDEAIRLSNGKAEYFTRRAAAKALLGDAPGAESDRRAAVTVKK
jgi:serine/threonine protein kinase/regulator of sirC expression with transglutaminase-like and TPR domain